MRRRAFTTGLLASAVGAARAAEGASAYALRANFVDDQGQACTLERWRGQPVVLTMAYGACRRICSTTLRRLETLHALAAQRHQPLQLLVVSLDPAEDRPEDWAGYRRLRGLSAAEWHFLCGDREATQAVARFLGLRYWDYDGHLLHDFGIARLDAEGRIAARLRWADDDLQPLL